MRQMRLQTYNTNIYQATHLYFTIILAIFAPTYTTVFDHLGIRLFLDVTMIFWRYNIHR